MVATGDGDHHDRHVIDDDGIQFASESDSSSAHRK
jgi:hypothetical protein